MSAVFVTRAAASGEAIGTIKAWPGPTAPAGWAFCYGQAVSRVTYAGLFAVVATLYGAGDGATTFNLPDLRGRVVAGVDSMGGSSAGRISESMDGFLGNTAGTEQVTLSTSHMWPLYGSTVYFDQNGGAQAQGVGYVQYDYGSTPSPLHMLQPTILLNYIIRLA